VSENPILQRERVKATKPPASQDEELSGPLIIGSTASPDSGSPDRPFDPKIGAAVANEPKELDPLLMKEAREKFEKDIRPQMLQATEDMAVAKTLLADLKTELEKEESVEFKVKLLKEGVIDLAARLGDLERIATAADEVARLSGEKSIDIQLQGLRQLNIEDPAVVKALVTHAQTLAMKVQTEGDLFQAVELLTIAKRAAEKAQLAAEMQTLQYLIGEVEKLRAEKLRAEKLRAEKK
jgi:ribosomal protein L9